MSDPIYFDPADPKARRLQRPVESPFSIRQLRRLIRENDGHIRSMRELLKKSQREFSALPIEEQKDGRGNGVAAALGAAIKLAKAKAKLMDHMARWWRKDRVRGVVLWRTSNSTSGWTSQEIIDLCPVNVIDDLASLMD